MTPFIVAVVALSTSVCGGTTATGPCVLESNQVASAPETFLGGAHPSSHAAQAREQMSHPAH